MNGLTPIFDLIREQFLCWYARSLLPNAPAEEHVKVAIKIAEIQRRRLA